MDGRCTVPLILCPIIFIILLLTSTSSDSPLYISTSFSFSYPSSSSSSSTLKEISEENYQTFFTSPLSSSVEKIINGSITRSASSSKRQQEKEKTKLERMEEGLARARAAIREAAKRRSYKFHYNKTFVPRGSVYINSYAFHQSHTEMEKHFRVWTYKEGEPPIFHQGPSNDIYSIEGQMIDELESRRSRFLAKSPEDALAFFLPISVVNIIQFIYRPYTNYSRERLQNIVADYIGIVSEKYPYWNRSHGADHFLISCHDWAPDIPAANPELYKHFMKVLCNANASEGFRPTRDISLPEIYLPNGKLTATYVNQPLYKRPILAFFSGGSHGDVRKILFDHWKEKDDEVRVYSYLPKPLNYSDLMGKSKFCLCPSGYEVASPRIVESIRSGCVPVIISDGYVLPFSDVLNWSQFSVTIPVRRIPEIKKILRGIPMEDYLDKQKQVMKVRRHFKLNRPAKPYDIMHMTMHSIWLRRLDLELDL